MKWVTREHARVDRIACAWLITRFIDPKPEFLFVPTKEVLAVAERQHAIPYDIPDVELGHRGPLCSFDAFIDRYELTRTIDPGHFFPTIEAAIDAYRDETGIDWQRDHVVRPPTPVP